MATSIKDLRYSIYINNASAKLSLVEMEKEAEKLRLKMQSLADDGKKNTPEYKEFEKQFKAQTEAMSKQKTEAGFLSLSMSDLRRMAGYLRNSLDKAIPGTETAKALRAELDLVNHRMTELKTTSNTNKEGGITGFLNSAWSLAALAVAEVGSFTKEFTTAALDAEKSMQRLSFAVKTVGGGTDSDLKKLAKQAEDLMGIFSHEEIEGAATKMLNYGLSTEQVIKLMPLMVDAAAASGKSLDDIATAVDKGTTSGVMARSALGQLGLAFKDTGSKAENFRLITEGLTKFTGGNEAAMKSQWGTLANLKIRWQEVQETIGNFILKAFIPLAERTTSLITDIPKLGLLLLNIGKAVLILAGYYAAYNGNLIANNFLLKEGIGLKIKKLVQDAYEAVVLEALIIKEALHAAVVEKTTLASKAAAVAQTLWNLAMKANPLGVFIGALTTVVGLIFLFGNSTREATAAQQAEINIRKKVSEQYDEQEAKIKMLVGILNNEKVSLDARKKALSDLQAIVPEYHANLTNEGKLINNNKSAIDEYLVSLEKEIRLQATKDELIELYKKKRLQEKSVKSAEKSAINAQSQIGDINVGEDVGSVPSSVASVITTGAILEKEKDKLKLTVDAIKSLESEIISTTITPKTISKSTTNDDGSLDKATAQKKKVDDAMKELETQNFIELLKIKKRYLDGDIKTEFDYNQSLLKQNDNYDSERKKTLQVLLKTVTDPSLKVEIQNKIAEIDKQDIDRRVDHLNKIKKILADADPIQAEKDAYANRLRELGIFGIAEDKLTKEQQNALKLLKIEHENKLKEIEKKADDEKVKIADEFYKDGIKAIDINNETLLLKLKDSLAKKKITQSQYDVYEKQLAIETANAKLILAQATYESINKIDFQSEDDKKQALEKAQQEIDKLKNLLTSAGIDLENVYSKVGKDIGKSIEDALGQSFSNVSNLFKSFAKSFLDESGNLTTKNLKGWKDWSKAVGELVQMALSAAIQINDEYYADKAAGLEAEKQTEYSALEKEKQQKLSVAGLTAEQKQQIEDDYAKKKQDSDQAYAQKELDLKKEQSASDTTLKVAQATVAGGLAIVQAYAQLGPVFGTAAALLIGTITGLQIDTMLKQNSAIQATTLTSTPSNSNSTPSSTGARVVNQAADGRYNVVGAQDRKLYNGVRYAGRATTGMVTTPTLMGEAGTELVIDAPTLSRLNLKAPSFIPWVLANRVQQRADGKYDTVQNQTAIPGADNSAVMAALIQVMGKNNQLLDYLIANGVDAFVLLSQFEKAQALQEKSLKKGSLKG